MADNVEADPGTGGATFATDDIAGVHYPRSKVVFGVDGVATDVSAGDPLPVTAASLPLPSGAATSAKQDTGNTSLATIAGAVAGTEMQVDVLTMPTVTVTGSVDATNAAFDVVGGGLEATALRVTLASDSTGVLSVDDNGGSLTVDGTVAVSGTVAVTDNAGSLTVDAPVETPVFVRLSDGAAAISTLPVSLASLPALAAGTNNIGDVDILSIAAGDNNIGNVDIVTMPNVTLAAGTNTNEVVGDVAHSVAVAGNPVLICGAAQDTDDTAPPNRVDAESDATRLATDRDGSLHVLPFGPQLWTYHVNGSSALTDTTVHAAPGAGLSLYVGTIVFSSGAATAINMFLEEGASTIIGPYYLEAIAGRGMAVQFNPPRKITANTALTVTTSAAIAHSVDITGYTAQG